MNYRSVWQFLKKTMSQICCTNTNPVICVLLYCIFSFLTPGLSTFYSENQQRRSATVLGWTSVFLNIPDTPQTKHNPPEKFGRQYNLNKQKHTYTCQSKLRYTTSCIYTCIYIYRYMCIYIYSWIHIYVHNLYEIYLHLINVFAFILT